MSFIDENKIVKIAKLARIAISEDEKKSLATELSKIMNLVEQLQEVDTDNVVQMVSVMDSSLLLRKDLAQDLGNAEEIVKNAAISEYNCFVVPKVIE